MLDFKFLQHYKALNVASFDDEYDNDLPKFKEYRKGEVLSGKKYEPRTDEAKNKMSGEYMLLENAYLVPKDLLKTNSLIAPDDLKKNASLLSRGLGDRIKDGANTYFKGAMVGATVGMLGALYFKKSLLIFGGLGAMAGGYVGYSMAEAKQNAGFITKIKQI